VDEGYARIMGKHFSEMSCKVVELVVQRPEKRTQWINPKTLTPTLDQVSLYWLRPVELEDVPIRTLFQHWRPVVLPAGPADMAHVDLITEGAQRDRVRGAGSRGC
jgi:hypothetical protein